MKTLFKITVIILLASCSHKNELFKSDAKRAKMITWVNEDWIYTGTYSIAKMDSIPNIYDRVLCPGDWVIRERK